MERNRRRINTNEEVTKVRSITQLQVRSSRCTYVTPVTLVNLPLAFAAPGIVAILAVEFLLEDL